jgi:hypothetical protein
LYIGTVVLQLEPPLVEYCKVEPVGQVPAGAEIEPPEGVPPTVVQVLLTTVAAPGAEVNTGQSGQAPGAVVTELVGLDVAVFTSQLQRVRIVWAGPDWLYVGAVVLHVMPPSVEYCKVEPVGQVPAGAEIEPPEGVPPNTVQVLLTTVAAPGADVSVGQGVDIIVKLTFETS